MNEYFIDIVLDASRGGEKITTIAVKKDDLRGYRFTLLNAGFKIKPQAFATAELWSTSEDDVTPQYSTGSITEKYVYCPVFSSMLYKRIVDMQLKMIQDDGEALRFPAFRVIVLDALDDEEGSLGYDEDSYWETINGQIDQNINDAVIKLTPTIINGTWWVNGEDTGVIAASEISGIIEPITTQEILNMF